jgi:hypothetical protein
MSRSQMRIQVVAAAIWAALSVCLLAPSALAFGVSSDPCTLITKAKLAKALHLAQVEETSRVGQSYPEESDGQVASRCSAFAWSGGKPKSYKQLRQKLANGTAAQLYFRTWLLDSGAPEENRQRWEETGFPRTLEGLEGAGLGDVIHGLHGTGFTPPVLGAEFAKEFQGARGSAGAAIAFWWDSRSQAIIFIELSESKQRPFVKHLEKIAKVAVPAFGL